jgi:hypothetical protein
MTKVLVIAGMHRSGTSLTANWLHECGLFLGEKLMSGGFGNPKGHYEDWEIVKIHENELKRQNHHAAGLRLKENFSNKLHESNINAIKSLVNKRKHMPSMGWKDPRGTLFLKDWKKTVPQMKCLAVYRHYNEVIDSLERRMRRAVFEEKNFKKVNRILHQILYPVFIKIEKRSYLKAWNTYNQNILEFKQKYPNDCIIISIENLLKHDKELFEILEKNFEININYQDIKKVYDEKLLSSKRPKMKRNNISETIYKNLNDAAVQL